MRAICPAERELCQDLKPLFDSGRFELIPNEGWLTKRDQFDAVEKEGPRWRMDAFYRRVRRDAGAQRADVEFEVANRCGTATDRALQGAELAVDLARPNHGRRPGASRGTEKPGKSPTV